MNLFSAFFCPGRLAFVGGDIANEILMHFRSQKKCAQDISLSEPIETGADGAPLELMEVIAEEGDLLEQVTQREQRKYLRETVESCLTDQERQVIQLRYGLTGDPPKRQREVAQITGLSRSYISRIEKRAMEKLKVEMERTG